MAPYQRGNRLPGELANKTGHRGFIESEMIKRLKSRIYNTSKETRHPIPWHNIPVEATDDMNLDNITSSDGSCVIISDEQYPYSRVGLIQTAIFKIDMPLLQNINMANVSPDFYNNLIQESKDIQQLFLPLNGKSFSKTTLKDTIRELIYEFFKEPNTSVSVLDTLQWLIYETYRRDGGEQYIEISCPNCDYRTPLNKNVDRCLCPQCYEDIWITDWLSFQNIVQDNFAHKELIDDVMSLFETLILFGQIKKTWTHDRSNLARHLFLKDGPLFLGPAYQNLVYKVQKFLKYANDTGDSIFLAGQEKTGDFASHLALIAPNVSSGMYLIPDSQYIANYIKFVETEIQPYGHATNYGVKILVKYDMDHSIVLNIPNCLVTHNPKKEDIIGFNIILATIGKLLSSSYENGLIPIEQANLACSISQSPSATILKEFFMAEELGETRTLQTSLEQYRVPLQA